MARLPVPAKALRRLLREVESSGSGAHVLAVGGTNELAPVLRQQFLRGRAEPSAVRVGGPEGADAYVHVLAGGEGGGVLDEPGRTSPATLPADVETLRRARRARLRPAAA